MTAKDWVCQILPDAEYKEDLLGIKFAIASPVFLARRGRSLTGWMYKDGRTERNCWVIAKKNLER